MTTFHRIRVIQTNVSCCKLLHLARNMSSTPTSDIQHLKSIFIRSVAAVSSDTLVNKVMRREDNNLFINDIRYELNKNLFLCGFGKAVLGMAELVANITHDHLQGGVLSVPVGLHPNTPAGAETLEQAAVRVYHGADNNMPDEQAMHAAIQVRDLARSLKANHLLLVLISGGGSALLPLPKPSISLDEKITVIQLLAASGATIQELNAVRKKLSALKGGQLALEASPARVASLILSDVVGNSLDVIASGPTTENRDPPRRALQVLNKYDLWDKVPPSVRNVLENKEQPSQLSSSSFPHVQNVIIGNNEMALTEAAEQARKLGYLPLIISDSIEGDVKEVAHFYLTLVLLMVRCSRGMVSSAEVVRQLRGVIATPLWLTENQVEECTRALRQGRGLCILAGGETTVHVQGTGKGGRNQELALRLSIGMHSLAPEEPLLRDVCFMSAGTDGIDGATSAAGAIGYASQVEQARANDLEPQHFVDNNDSFNFYSKLKNPDNLIVTGHTGTNVTDIHAILFPNK